MDPNLVQFYRQYLQQVTDLCYPPLKLLVQPDIQQDIYRCMFDENNVTHLPPPNYQRRVLKSITEKIESAIQDPAEEEVIDLLMQRMAYLVTVPQPSNAELAEKRAVVTYHPPSDYETQTEPLFIEEARYLLGVGGNVGLRTWDACLRLGYYLTTEARSLIQGKNVLEVGAGTGLLSMICAKYLDASFVLATDGIAHIVDSIQHNMDLNSSASTMSIDAKILNWTDLSEIHELLADSEGRPRKYDVVLGSDITYNLDYFVPLVETFDALVRLFPDIKIIIAGAIRNINTFSTFVDTCAAKNFRVVDVPFECPEFHHQTGFFHTIALPIRLLSIERSCKKAQS